MVYMHDRVTNEKILERVGEERKLWRMLAKRKDELIDHILRDEGLVTTIIEGYVYGKRCRGRLRMNYIQ